MLQLYELCRLCAQKKRNKFDLFTGENNKEDETLLAKISVCLSVQVTREDSLPKMICFDCHKSVEQFNTFRIKCHKAEERLNKMLSLSVPSKLTVDRIKKECLETDFQETGCYLNNIEPQKYNEPIFSTNLKITNNVKSEVEDENVQENFENDSSAHEWVQIISEEIVNQEGIEDVKQPQIELFPKNFYEEIKYVHSPEIESGESCDIKVIPKILLHINEDVGSQCIPDVGFLNQEIEPINFIEIKEPTPDSDEALVNSENIPVGINKLTEGGDSFTEKLGKEKHKRKRKIGHLVCNNEEIDERYLTLTEGETCDVDMEEMEAVIKKKQDPNAKFECDKCSRSFKFFKCLRKHKDWHNSQPDIFICDICKKEFSSLKSLKSHINLKHLSCGEKRFECLICHKCLQTQGQLNAHSRNVHKCFELSCLTCKKKFKNKSCLQSHSKVHQVDRPYVCDQCGQTFKWSNALKVHIQWHKQEKNYLCSQCGKKFSAKKNLIEHLNIHTGRRPFTCEICQATFIQLSAYSKHLYQHNEGKKSHKCDKCDKKYSHAYMLRQHLLRHTGLRPYECSVCQCSFKSQSDLWCHTKIHQEKKYGCGVCGRKFALSKTLRDHMVIHTGIKHMCPVPGCGKTYTQRFALTKHFTKHHPSLYIIKKRRGRRAPLGGSTDSNRNLSVTHFIQYDFREKTIEEERLIIC